MKKSLTKNYIYNMLYQILKIAIPLITTPYISRVLGAEGIGIYSYTLSIVTYFILFGTLGIALYGQREIAYVQDDIEKRSRIFWEINLLRLITLFISTSIFYLTFCINNNYEIYYKILLLELFANLIDISWYFQGLEDFKKTVIRNTIVKLVSIVCIFLIVKTAEDLYKYFIIYVLANCFGNLSLWLSLKKYIKKIKLRELNIIKHIKPTLSLFIPQIAIQIYTVLDKTMIGTIIIEKEETGFYEQAEKIVKLLLSIITALGTVMLPRVANIFAKGDNDKVKSYILYSFNIVYFLAFPIIFGIISIADKFVPIFYGVGYEKVAMLIKVISPIILIIGMSNVIGNQFLLTTKRQKEYTISVAAGAIINFILNLILINLMASIGASIATVIAELCVTLIQIYFIRKDINIKQIIHKTTNYFVSSIVMFIGSFIIGKIIILNELSIILQAIFGVLVYLAILLVLKDEFMLQIIQAIKNKISRRGYGKI